MSIKALKYRIDASKVTTQKLQWVLDRCRELYNAALIERRDVYEMHVMNPRIECGGLQAGHAPTCKPWT